MVSILPSVLTELRKEHPGIALKISTTNTFAVLTKREADIALRPTSKSPPEGLIGRQLIPVPDAIYGAPDYLARANDARPLADHDWLTPDASLHETAASCWFRQSLPEVNPVMRADSLVALRDMARAGLGLTLLPIYLGEASTGLTMLPGTEVFELGSTLWMLTHEDLRRVARVDPVVRTLTTAIVAQHRASSTS